MLVKGQDGIISQSFQVKYEKLPRFCGFCGLSGHASNECENGVHRESEMQYSDFLLASPNKRVKSKGVCAKSETWSGSSNQSYKQSPRNAGVVFAMDEDLKDDAASPLKNASKEIVFTGEKSARKRLSTMWSDSGSGSSGRLVVKCGNEETGNKFVSTNTRPIISNRGRERCQQGNSLLLIEHVNSQELPNLDVVGEKDGAKLA